MKKNKLSLSKETKAKIKEHPFHFTYIVDKGLSKAKWFSNSKKENEILYVLNNDAKFWLVTYNDPYFGEITNDKKVTKIMPWITYSPIRYSTRIRFYSSHTSELLFPKDRY